MMTNQKYRYGKLKSPSALVADYGRMTACPEKGGVAPDGRLIEI